MTSVKSEALRVTSLADFRATVAGHLRAQLPEIESRIFAAVSAVPSPDPGLDPSYFDNLRTAIVEAIEYAIDGIEDEREPEPIPRAVRLQVRRAARAGIPLDTVLRRFAAGERLIIEFIMDGADSLPRPALRQILRTHGALVDHMMAASAAEHVRETERYRQTPTQRRGEQVRKLLGGASGIRIDLNYDLNNWHVGLLIRGEETESTLVALARVLESEVLVVPAGDESEPAWAWLGSRRQPPMTEIVDAWGELDAAVAIGEPRRGLEGWRQTHLEAKAAYRLMSPESRGAVRSRDVILVAAVLQDETLANALTSTYLRPLDGRADTGRILRDTLRAYFRAGQNAATAAAVLGVNRHTVERRVRSVEEKIGQIIDECRGQLEVALEVERLRSDSNLESPST